MSVGDLVQIQNQNNTNIHYRESRFCGMRGVILQDHSPQRPPDVGRVFDVMWDNGAIEDMYSHALEVVNESR
jgi:hypothetical protein